MMPYIYTFTKGEDSYCLRKVVCPPELLEQVIEPYEDYIATELNLAEEHLLRRSDILGKMV